MMETIPMMTTLMNMMPELLAFFGIFVLGLLGMYVSEVANGQRPNPFSRKAKRERQQNKRK